MDVKKGEPDHTDVTYRDAVSKLRNILSPKPTDSSQEALKNLNMAPSPTNAYPNSFLKNIGTYPGKYGAGDLEKLNLPLSSAFTNPRPRPISAASALQNIAKSTSNLPAVNNQDLLGFIDKQEQYILQLEKETSVCRQELSGVLDKVKDVISENEELHGQQKREVLTALIKQLEEKPASGKFEINGKSEQLIRDSRMAELEAQLVQYKRNLRLAQEEVLELRRDPQFQMVANSKIPAANSKCVGCEAHLAQLDSITR